MDPAAALAGERHHAARGAAAPRGPRPDGALAVVDGAWPLPPPGPTVSDLGPGREPPHPAVDRDVVHPDAALGEQFLDVPEGQPVALQADRHHDHLGREPEAGEGRAGR
jgi:hypothetical protein